MLFASRVGVAIGEAALIPAGTSLIADYFQPVQRTRALSVFSMGSFLGGGLALMGGGALLRILAAHKEHLYGLETLPAWRVTLLFLGAAGLLLAPFVWFLREPRRLDDEGRSAEALLTAIETLRQIRAKGLALAAHNAGFSTLTLGMVTVQAWAPTLFIRQHGWTVSEAGLRLGLLPLLLGAPGALTGAAIAEAFARRGRLDGKLLVGVISGFSCAVAAVLMTAHSVITALVAMGILQFVVCFNYGVLHAALVELLPNRLRAQGAAVYIIWTGLYSMTLGPWAVGLLTEHLFHDRAAVGLSLRIVVPGAFLLAAIILTIGLRPYRAAMRSLPTAPQSSAQPNRTPITGGRHA
jgi:MFS family permease